MVSEGDELFLIIMFILIVSSIFILILGFIVQYKMDKSNNKVLNESSVKLKGRVSPKPVTYKLKKRV